MLFDYDDDTIRVSRLDPDAPAWSDTYFEVARQKSEPTPVRTGR